MMIDESSMLRLVLEKTSPLPAVECPLADSLHAFAARDIFAQMDSPAFDNAFYDGYALPASGLHENTRLMVRDEQPAGKDRGLRVSEGECVRIFTGAPLPANTDAVVMQEDIALENGHIRLKESVPNGFGIRRQGADVCRGQKILSKGQKISPATIGLLASQGLSKIPVGSKPRITILCTGNEILPPDAKCQPGQIHESNGPMLTALFDRHAAQRPGVRLLPDSMDEIRAAIRHAEENCDVLLICGGMSVGDYDFAPAALKEEGFHVEAHRVKVKPGKPFLFGTREKCHVFGFPGNPVSAYLTALLFARPAILRFAGAEGSELSLPTVPARLAVAAENPGDRPHYVRGHFDGKNFSPAGLQQSHAIFSLSQANALLRLPEAASLHAGEQVSVLLLP